MRLRVAPQDRRNVDANVNLSTALSPVRFCLCRRVGVSVEAFGEVKSSQVKSSQVKSRQVTAGDVR